MVSFYKSFVDQEVTFKIVSMSMSNHECTGVAQFTTIKQGMSESALPEYKQMTGIFDLNKSIANTNIFLHFTLTVYSAHIE